jgi:hypothetical protein
MSQCLSVSVSQCPSVTVIKCTSEQCQCPRVRVSHCDSEIHFVMVQSLNDCDYSDDSDVCDDRGAGHGAGEGEHGELEDRGDGDDYQVGRRTEDG